MKIKVQIRSKFPHKIVCIIKDEILLADLESDEKRLLLQINKSHTVKDLTQKLSSLPINPQEDKTQNRIGDMSDMSGLISKAKEGLAKSKSKGDISRCALFICLFGNANQSNLIDQNRICVCVCICLYFFQIT